MKLLVIVSALDLQYRLGCTPSWWQLLKGFHETGHEVIAIPYLGAPVESPWWRTYENPCSTESKLYYRVSEWNGSASHARSDRFHGVSRFLIERHIRPKWKRQLFRVMAREGDIDAIFMMNAPVNHFTSLPTAVREEFGVKVAYYEGDMPTILPRHATHRGFRFSYYEGADLGEYDVFFSNSKGAIPEIKAMGAKNVYPLYWAADPDLFRPVDVEKEYDVSFYGHGDQLREEWMTRLIARPSNALPGVRFVVGGGGFRTPLGGAERAGVVPFSAFGRFVGRSRINLNITRLSHTRIYASATSRPFELAAYGACIVSQPYLGIEEWFRLGRELLVVNNEEEALETYKWLLTDDEARMRLGWEARKRIMYEHTFHHRAREVVRIIESTT